MYFNTTFYIVLWLFLPRANGPQNFVLEGAGGHLAEEDLREGLQVALQRLVALRVRGGGQGRRGKGRGGEGGEGGEVGRALREKGK